MCASCEIYLFSTEARTTTISEKCKQSGTKGNAVLDNVSASRKNNWVVLQFKGNCFGDDLIVGVNGVLYSIGKITAVKPPKGDFSAIVPPLVATVCFFA